MIIDKILNNNVITTITEQGHESVVMGRGIGFKKKIRDVIDESKIEKIFLIQDSEQNKRLQKLFDEIPIEYFAITEKIVKRAEDMLGKKLDEEIYISLTDHIAFAIKRAKQNINLHNPMLLEIKSIYKQEFELGMYGLEQIEKMEGVKLPEDEAAFIVLHIINASLGESMTSTLDITILTRKALDVIKKVFKISLNEDSLEYVRLVTHLKFFSQRILNNEQVPIEDEELYNIFANKYKLETKCANEIKELISSEYKYTLNKQELLYLILHIQRVISK